MRGGGAFILSWCCENEAERKSECNRGAGAASEPYASSWGDAIIIMSGAGRPVLLLGIQALIGILYNNRASCPLLILGLPWWLGLLLVKPKFREGLAPALSRAVEGGRTGNAARIARLDPCRVCR